MMRLATAATVLALGLGVGFSSARPAKAMNWGPDQAVSDKVAAAEVSFDDHAFGRVVEILAPTVDPESFATLSEDMQYQALALYARALYRLGEWDDAHEAFISLTANANATPVDWAFRLDTAEKVGDDDDAAEALDHFDQADADDDLDTGVLA